MYNRLGSRLCSARYPYPIQICDAGYSFECGAFVPPLRFNTVSHLWRIICTGELYTDPSCAQAGRRSQHGHGHPQQGCPSLPHSFLGASGLPRARWQGQSKMVAIHGYESSHQPSYPRRHDGWAIRVAGGATVRRRGRPEGNGSDQNNSSWSSRSDRISCYSLESRQVLARQLFLHPARLQVS